MLTMQNAWERQLHGLSSTNENKNRPPVYSNNSNSDINNNRPYGGGEADDYEFMSQRQHQQQHQSRKNIGPDRSISAPPPSGSGLNLSYNHNLQDDSTLFSLGQHEVSRNNLSTGNASSRSSSNRAYISADQPTSVSINSNMERQFQTERQMHSSSPYQQGLVMGSNNHRAVSASLVDELDFGENRSNMVTRSQSAAPNISIPPPPGMGGRSSGGPFLFDSANDILQAGMRRPASTGVIGQMSSNDNGASISRPIPKTLMELIQEDFPKTPSPEYANLGVSEYGVSSNGNRPRSASPPRSKTFLATTAAANQEYSKETQGTYYREEERADVHVSSAKTNPNPQVITYVQQGASPAPQTHYVSIPVSQLQHNGGVVSQLQHNGGVAVQAAQHVYPVTTVQQHPHYDIQPVYYATQRGAGGVAETVPVYMNTAPYYTVQYASHEANPQILHHHHHPGSHPISIVPMHHSPTAHTPQMAVNNGNYSYWHPSDGIPSHPTPTTYMTTQHGGVKSYKKTSVIPSKEKSLKRRGNNVSVKKQASSSLLEEFRSSKPRTWTLNSIKSHILQFCQDQNGSRFIQQQLEIASSEEKQLVLKEILPSIRVLRNDVFGNYVIQKLLEYGTDSIRLSLYTTFQNEMLEMSLQMYGCRVVQKAFETFPYPILTTLLQEFHENVMTCIHDQNGNHVIQKIMEIMSFKVKLGEGDESAVEFILQDVLAQVSELSCHPYGCRVMQRILEHCVESQRVQALDCISACQERLLDDQYGNYVIQHVLQFGRESDRTTILKIILKRDLLTLSRQKFASNVVEKLLKYGNSAQRNIMVKEMLKEVDGSSVVLWMVRDAYANYVVQTTLDVLGEGDERTKLMEELNCHSTQLRNFTFAKHIVAKLNDK